MSGKYAWIIFLVLGLWHVIGTFAEKAAKKQQLKAQGSQQLRPSARRHPGESPTSTTLVDRAGELAARRKAQLEELRRRRASHHMPAAGSSPVTLRPTLAGAQTPLVPGRTVPQAIPVARAARPPQPVPARIAPARIAPAPQARSAPGSIPKPRTRPRLTSQPAESKTEYDRSLHALGRKKPVEEPSPTAGRRHLSLPGLRDEPIGPTMLRRMVMYREILDTPIALRDQQIWERW